MVLGGTPASARSIVLAFELTAEPAWLVDLDVAPLEPVPLPMEGLIEKQRKSIDFK